MTATIRQFAGSDPNYTQADAFPPAVSFVQPLGNQVIVQLRSPRVKSQGGIVFTQSDQDFDKDQIRVGKVIALGPLAYKNRDDSTQEWPEGAWVKPMDFVRVPTNYGIDKWIVRLDEDRIAIFGSYNDFDMKGKILGDPLALVDYV